MPLRVLAPSVIAFLLLAACGLKNSQLVVLYKNRVAPGNSVVSFLNHNDETGQYASQHCEELKQLYEARDEPIKYVCSTIVFDEFKPGIK